MTGPLPLPPPVWRIQDEDALPLADLIRAARVRALHLRRAGVPAAEAIARAEGEYSLPPGAIATEGGTP